MATPAVDAGLGAQCRARRKERVQVEFTGRLRRIESLFRAPPRNGKPTADPYTRSRAPRAIRAGLGAPRLGVGQGAAAAGTIGEVLRGSNACWVRGTCCVEQEAEARNVLAELDRIGPRRPGVRSVDGPVRARRPRSRRLRGAAGVARPPHAPGVVTRDLERLAAGDDGVVTTGMFDGFRLDRIDVGAATLRVRYGGGGGGGRGGVWRGGDASAAVARASPHACNVASRRAAAG